MIHSSAILEINTKNFLHNYKYLDSISNKVLTGATIKANAYGLGDKKIFNLLYSIGCRHFFVATFEEAYKIPNIHQYQSLISFVTASPLHIFKRLYFIASTAIN